MFSAVLLKRSSETSLEMRDVLLQHFFSFRLLILRISYFSVSLQGPKSEDDIGDGAEADEADELSGYEPESDVNTMTVHNMTFY